MRIQLFDQPEADWERLPPPISALKAVAEPRPSVRGVEGPQGVTLPSWRIPSSPQEPPPEPNEPDFPSVPGEPWQEWAGGYIEERFIPGLRWKTEADYLRDNPRPVPPVPTVPRAQTLAPTLTNIRSWLEKQAPDYLTRGLSAYKDTLAQAFGNQFEILGNDKIRLGGRTYDLIGNYGGPGAAWWGGDVTDEYGGEGGRTRLPGLPIGGFDINAMSGFPGFDDPNLRLYEEGIRKRIGELTQPVVDPYRDRLIAELQDRMAGLRAPIESPQYDQLLRDLNTRMEELRGPLYGESEENLLRTTDLDAINRQREEAKRDMVGRLAQLGHEKDSGTIAEAMLQIDRYYDQLSTQAQTAFSTEAIRQTQARKGQAIELGGQAAGVEQAKRQEQQARMSEALGLAEALSNVSYGTRQEQEQIRNQTLTLLSMLPELDERTLNQAMAILSGQPYTAPSLVSQMLGYGQLGLQGQQQALQAKQYGTQNLISLLTGLGSILPSILKMFPTGSGSAGGSLPAGAG